MALVPYALRPSTVIRRNAIRRGLLGRSLAWKIVAAVVFGRNTVKSVFGRHPEQLGTVRLSAGQRVTVSHYAPTLGLGRRQRRHALAQLRAAALADVAAANRES